MSIRSVAVVGLLTVGGLLTCGVVPAGAALPSPSHARHQVRLNHAGPAGRHRSVEPACVTCIEIDGG